jgi:chromatin assembly factor 1 subunit B
MHPRSTDGLTLIMSSSDGFCSTLSFAPGELGQQYAGSTSVGQSTANPSTPAANATPLPTPTHGPSPIKTNHTPTTSTGPVPPASPARSNSACSVATQSSLQHNHGVVNNPTPTLGTVPSVTAAHSAQPPTLPLPLTTPPRTPVSSAPQSNPASGSVLGKRGEFENEDNKDVEQTTAHQPKKRRIAPTLISTGTDASSSKESNP